MRVIRDTVQRKWMQLVTVVLTSFSLYSFLLHRELEKNQPRRGKIEHLFNSSEYSRIQTVVSERVKHQQEVCKSALESNKGEVKSKELTVPQFVLDRLIVDETHKLIYCSIPKAGSSNWKRIFVKLLNPEYQNAEDLLEINHVHHIELPTLSSFTEKQQKEFLTTFRKYLGYF